eukprot:8551080-Lingulodinium_polyedra.AAC.1
MECASARFAAADGRCNAMSSARAAPSITEAAPKQHASSTQAACKQHASSTQATPKQRPRNTNQRAPGGTYI